MTLPRVVVVGAGFAGLQVVKGLKNVPCEVALFDKHNYHLFQPLLYQVATAALSPADIAYPIRRIFRHQPNVNVSMVRIDRIDLKRNFIGVGKSIISYDYLVIATGATHSYFGRDDWEASAPGLKSIDDAIAIRKHMLVAFEEAEHEADPDSRRAKLTFIVVGGGPTGVEMAGALREIAAQEMPRDFRSIDTVNTRIILLQGGDRLLPAMHPDLSARAKRDLEAMGVEVRVNARVTGIDDGGVFIGDERIECQNVIWAAGVQASRITRSLDVPLDKAGRVVVNPDLSIPNFPNTFVVGDAASIVDLKTGQQVPGLAPAAMQMGQHVARILHDEILLGRSIERPPFRYNDKGVMATIGKARAVADIRGWRFGGFFAWLTWGLVHIMFLISFRNKIFVMASWMWNYIAGSRGVRLITGPVNARLSRPALYVKQDGAPQVSKS